MVPLQQPAVITQKKQFNSHVFQFTFQTQHPVMFTPGQYATVIIDAATRRQYSFCSPANNLTLFDIVVDVSPMGPGSKFFIEKKVGDRVEILAPLGNFQLASSPRKKIFVATGTGVAPLWSMIASFPSESMALYWGLRYEEDLFWTQQLEDLHKRSAHFQYTIVLSKPTSVWKRASGHVTEYVVKQENDILATDFYLCGNRQMVEDVQTALLAQKVPAERIKTELF